MPTTSIAHMPFFQALAGQEEDGPEWNATKAGLLVMRLVDRAWEAPRFGRMERWEIAAVADAVSAVDQGNVVRRLLEQVIVAVSEKGVQAATVLPRLAAYARALEFDAQWTLAADVYTSVVDHALIPEHGDLASSSAWHIGYCLRMAGELGQATEAYARARLTAQECGNEDDVFRAELGLAAIAMHRGNLPEAEKMLDRVIAAAAKAQRAEMLSCALHDRAEVAARRGELDASVVFGHRALELCTDPTRRDRILADVANALGIMGQHEAARQAFEVLAVTAQEQHIRWLALVNLLELAAESGSETLFEQYRRELTAVELPPSLSGYFHLYVGKGCLRFERYPSAKAAFERAVAVAQEHSVN
ncbi:MAG: hypothetical protein ACREON_00615, partial [Gemmatimonadaceae bacterium]